MAAGAAEADDAALAGYASDLVRALDGALAGWVERRVAEVDGVRAGNVIAFGIEGRRHEGLVVVAEARTDDAHSVRQVVEARVRETVGLSAHDIVLVVPGSLPKTSSGKLQRSLCRDRYLGQDLQLV